MPDKKKTKRPKSTPEQIPTPKSGRHTVTLPPSYDAALYRRMAADHETSPGHAASRYLMMQLDAMAEKGGAA